MLESKRKAIIFFLIALVLAALSGFLVLKKVQALNSNLGTMVEVVVANKSISSRAVITPNDIATEEIPKKYVREEHITEVNQLINKVSVVPLSTGDIITSNMLKQASAVTEADSRLVSVIQSERVSFDEALQPLDRVDLIVSHTFDGEPVTEVFMKDIKVARTTENDKDFIGVQLEIPFKDVPRLVHMQNYADSLRVIKSNVAQQKNENKTTETDSETETDEAKPASEPKTEEKKAEEAKEGPKEEETKKKKE
ncbi:Flp pilus assembly protein CpaB [Virgibacillus flavescens]|uniref:Flp pilus assembly protein CpaB n=1 Tax=Virgibacillus flavescens TaxID=1611422 RepID=UPI003D340257